MVEMNSEALALQTEQKVELGGNEKLSFAYAVWVMCKHY